MATNERIDIEVTDKVAASIPTKLREIATNATAASSSVDKLKKALSALPSDAFAALSSSASTIKADLSSVSGAVSTIEAALSKLATEVSAATTAFRELDAAQKAAATSAGKAGAAANDTSTKMATAGAAAGRYRVQLDAVGRSSGLASHQMGNLVAQINDVGVSLAGGQNPLLVLIQQGSQIQYLATTVEGGFATLLKATLSLIVGQQALTTAETEAAAANTALAASALASAQAQAAQAGIAANTVLAQQALTVAETEAATAAAALTAAQATLAAAQTAVASSAAPAAADVAALAAAESAATAAAEAATIANAELATAQVAVADAALVAAKAEQQLAVSSAGTALGLGAVGAVLVGLAPVALAAGKGIMDFHKEINDQAGIKDYVNTLGLTDKELKKLTDTTVTYGDMATGVWETIKEGASGLSPVFDAIGSAIGSVIDLIWQTLKNFTFALIALFQGTYKAVITIWNQFPAAFQDLFAQAMNGAIGWLESLANKTIDVLNSLGGSFEHVTLQRMENANAGAAAKMGADIVNGYMDSFRSAEAGYNAFLKRVNENSAKAAKERLATQAKGIIEDRAQRRAPKGRKGREDHTEENRARALELVNQQLDNELARMGELKDARAVQQRFDQIEQALAQKKITLNTTEAQTIRDKIAAIIAQQRVQQAQDRIEQDLFGAQQQYNDTIAAATGLLQRHIITQEQFNAEQVKAQRALQESTDPAFKFQEALDASQRTMGLYGDALDRANYLEQIRQAYLEKGINIDTTANQQIKDKVAALQAQYAAQQQLNYVNSQVNDVLQPLTDYQKMIDSQQAVYDELERRRQADLISEDQYQSAKAALAVKYNQQRLNGEADFFGALADITKDGTGAVGAISKAAAIAQATIQGYLAIQNAIAAPPGWPYNAASVAAVTIMQAANLARIVSSSVGSFATGGQFIVGGRDGVDKNNINMNVTKGERVTIETRKQQRANDNQASGPAPAINFSPRIINSLDPRAALDAVDTSEGEQVIMNIISRNAPAVQRLLGSR